ncbi:hypothetical protein J0A67_01090 [Algoriphagus aestuariicola]|jgi:hypothetical protein|uniref:Uncharacterized protein n=1 Tax=Algoriphagus aestuariicola TaxID=1852016 RepID=A0ABS3BMH0_9BACT|nr:hypothetical protein [Algoriphagus aestuariicola]MBN7799431.1 hypothetical protein [Algoriphagus aestuariicola]
MKAKISTTDPNQKKSNKELAREAKVTKEDLQALGPKDDNLREDGGDDEELLRRRRKVDFAGEELDVPGSELDDDQEAIGSEDEENNLYSNPDDEEER